MNDYDKLLPTNGFDGDPIADVHASMFAKPVVGTKAADLTPAERMWLLRAAGVPMDLEFLDGFKVRMVTRVPCAIVDRGDGTYIIAVGAGPRGTS
jgi:hypothetical protein